MFSGKNLRTELRLALEQGLNDDNLACRDRVCVSHSEINDLTRCHDNKITISEYKNSDNE